MENIDKVEEVEDSDIAFKKDFTARQWLSQQTGRLRVVITQQLGSIFLSLTDESKAKLGVSTPDDLKDLTYKKFQEVMSGFSEAYGDDDTVWDSFLG